MDDDETLKILCEDKHFNKENVIEKEQNKHNMTYNIGILRMIVYLMKETIKSEFSIAI